MDLSSKPNHGSHRGAVSLLPSLSLALALLFASASAVPVAGQVTAAPDPVKLFNMAQDAHERGDLTEAIRLYRSALEAYPDFPEAHLQLGVALKQSGDVKSAETEFRKALALRVDWTLPMVSLASLLSAEGRLDEADQLIKRAVGVQPDSVDGLTVLAEIALRRAVSSEELRQLLSRLKGAIDDRVPAYTLVVVAALERSTGDLVAARRTISRVLVSEPSSRAALGEATEIAIASEDTESALDLSQRLLSVAPADDSSLLVRARALAASGQNESALAVLGRIAKPNAASADLKERLTTVTSNDIVSLEAKLKEDPENLEAVARLCLLYRTRDPERALELCRLAVRSEPGNMLFAVRYAAALLQTGKLAEATAVLLQLKAKAPENHTIRANLAAALFQQKRWVEARAEYEWICSSQPDKPITYYFLGIIADELREYPTALSHYERFLRGANATENGLEIEKVQLRLPALRRQIKERGGR